MKLLFVFEAEVVSLWNTVARGCAVLALCVSLAASASAQVDTSAAREARAALRQVQQQYGNNSNWSHWSRQLRWPDLTHELAAGDHAIPESLERAATVLRAAENVSFSSTPFQRLAAALQARAAELEPIPAADWPARARDKYGKDYVPLTVRQLAAAREQVRDALDAMERRVPALRSSDNNWAQFLSWGQTRQLLDTTYEPPLEDLARLESRWYQVLLVWDDGDVVEASLAVRTLIPLLRAWIVNETRDAHDAAWELIADQIEADSDPEQILKRVAERESLGQGGPLTRNIRRHYSHPNVILEVSVDWFKRQAWQLLDEPYQINGYYAGAATRGSGRLTGQLEVAIDRSAATATLVQQLSATSRSSSRGGRDGVSVSSRATTSITAQKLFRLDGVGLRASPATASANTSIAYDSVAAGGGRRGSIGTSEAYGSRGQAEADASNEASQSARSRLDAHGRDWMSAFNRDYQEQFRNPWLATPHLAPVIRVRGQDGRLAWQALLAPLRGFEFKRPSAFATAGDATLRVAASAIEQHATAVYSHRSMTGDELTKALADTFGSAPQEASELSVRFAGRPCSVEIAAGDLRCTLHFAEFASGGSSYPPLSVELRYKLVPRDRGVVLVRVENPSVSLWRAPGDDGPLTGRQQTLRIGAQRKIAQLLSEEYVWPHVRLPLPAGEPQKFEVADLLADRGWLQMALVHVK